MNNSNLISVIIPVYNCEKYLADAIESVICQTYKNIEILVIDDGSTDKSAMVASKFIPQIQYYFQNNQGASAARNHGLSKAKGDFLAFLDADDIWLPNKLEKQMEVKKNNSNIDFIFTLMQQFCSSELTNVEKAKIKGDGEILPGYSLGSMLIKKEDFLKVGNFATDFKVGEFIEWYLRAKEQGLNDLVIDEILIKRRLHASNMGRNKRDAYIDYLKIVKASLDKKRQKT